MVDNSAGAAGHQTLTRPDGVRIAHVRVPPAPGDRRPGVMFCGGFVSDMTGTKAVFLDDLCRRRGQGYVRFDYQGHGASDGRFEDGTIGRWAEDAVAVLDEAAEGPQILVGSSMGGWMAVLAALARPERVAGLVCVAAAPDFTEDWVPGEIVLLFNTAELDTVFPAAASVEGVTVISEPTYREYPGDGVTYEVMVSMLRDPDGHIVELNNRLSPPIEWD